MLNNEATACTITQLTNPTSQAATFQGGWIDVRGFEGDLLITQQVGAITGSIAGKIQDATDSGGAGAADVAGGAFPVLSVANDARKLVIPKNSTRGFIRYVATIVTGPSIVSAAVIARPKGV